MELKMPVFCFRTAERVPLFNFVVFVFISCSDKYVVEICNSYNQSFVIYLLTQNLPLIFSA